MKKAYQPKEKYVVKLTKYYTKIVTNESKENRSGSVPTNRQKKKP
jgi:hypothetical protein